MKYAIDREKKGRGYDMIASTIGESRLSSQHHTQAHSPMRQSVDIKYMVQPPIEYDFGGQKLIITQPSFQIKSPESGSNTNKSMSIQSPLSPNSNFKNNPNNLFRQIIQERLNDVDHKIAQEISSSTKHTSSARQVKALKFQQKFFFKELKLKFNYLLSNIFY